MVLPKTARPRATSGRCWPLVRHEARTALLSALGGGTVGMWALVFALAVNRARGFELLPQFATVEQALAAMGAADLFIVPLIGVLLGYNALSGEREAGTLPFLLVKPLRRSTVVLGKWAGRVLALSGGFTLVALLALTGIYLQVLAVRAAGEVSIQAAAVVGAPGAVVGYLFSLWLLAVVFLSLSFAASSGLNHSSGALALGLSSYLGLGLAWNALLAPGPQADGGRMLLYLLSPFVAWLNWSTQLSGASLPWQEAFLSAADRPWFASLGFYGAVMAVWILAALVTALVALNQKDVT